MRRTCVLMLVGVVALAAALVSAQAASAEGAFERCPADLEQLGGPEVPGPEICTFSWSVDNFIPAGTRCTFDVAIHYDVTATIYFFENPPRAVAHMVSLGSATNLTNGHTLVRVARFTETASPVIVFTDHGLLARYSLPGGHTVTVWAGYQQESVVPPEPAVFHGNPPPGIDPTDTQAFCAALA